MAQDKDQKTLNVPPLRFPGFTDEWKKVTFKEVITLQRGSSPRPIINFITHDDSGVNWVRIGDMPATGRIVTQTEEKITADGALKSRRVNIGDLILSNSMSFGQPYIMGIDGYIHDGWFVLKNFEKYLERDFLCNLLITPIIQKQYSKLAAGGVVQNISSELVNSVKFSIPPLSEQKKIVSLLNAIDERIEIQNKIIEDLKKLKSAIYETIFNSLKGEIFSLGDVAEIIKGKQLNGEFLTESGDYYVMNGGVEPSGYYNTFNVSADKISISEGGNSCGYIQWNSVPFWSGGHCYTLNIKDKSVENKYLYHYLKWSEPEIMKLRIGSGLPNIQKKDLERVSIIIPTNSTQKQIIDLVDSIDSKIDTEYSISLLLNHQKTYLLSKLFK